MTTFSFLFSLAAAILLLSKPWKGNDQNPEPVTLWYHTVVILLNGLAFIFSTWPCSRTCLFHVTKEIYFPCRAVLLFLPSWWPTCCQCQVPTISLRWTCTPHRSRWAAQNLHADARLLLSSLLAETFVVTQPEWGDERWDLMYLCLVLVARTSFFITS